ncbi:MAG: type II secretion system protein GspG [Phycisphaerales bacterium JB052]
MSTPTTTAFDRRANSMISRSYTQTRPGFSLIELTAVLVIIGILMAGAALAVPGFLKRARTKVTKTSMTTIKTAINTYSANNAGSAPESLSVMIPDYLDPGADMDAWERAFYYRAPGQTQMFDLISAGPDGEFQTGDDINVWTMDVRSSE